MAIQKGAGRQVRLSGLRVEKGFRKGQRVSA